jgi:hypothetical protein
MSFDVDDTNAFRAWLEQNGPIESIQAVICDQQVTDYEFSAYLEIV